MALPPRKDELLSDYCILRSGPNNRLSDVERLTLVGGNELGRLLRRMTNEDPTELLRAVIEGADVSMFREAAAFYGQLTDPQEIFRKPEGVIAPTIAPVHGLPNAGEICDLRYPSAYVGFHGSMETLRIVIPENNTVTVRLWRHNEVRRPAIIAVHGFAMGDQRSNSIAFLPGLFYKLGFDIALMELPFHGKRLNPDFRDAGHSLFPSANVFLTNEAMLQSISDLRQLRLILRALGCKTVGCIGISLGAYIASTWAAIDSLDFCVPMVPLASMGEMVAHQFNDDAEIVRQALQIHEPLRYAPATPAENVFIVAGSDDKVIPRYHPEAISKHFGDAPISWFKGSHDMTEGRDEVFSSIVRYLSSRNLIDPTEAP